ncbi:hypothetical protein AURANDRAFT_67783 [Aureococcus anophagefferens]|uniref:Uncharacterized protein n=1 Tax=Aureococcus anophagefferens TaxID=44056 RepID=F0YMD7_AURAN|nr:hypothetical protein AURANDRAFT_67783 [Aureococcus anophagefferens]EGB03714.1 hypothetical protein AURANDRAFT_67783 [Aureococcus anophagefferens]|eukprot:XP_009041569.1 hypothetical protein AURANDRAFT_67783 [Aureococcus anophagefferens]
MSLTPRSDLSVGTRVQAQTAVIPLARKKGVTSAHVVGKKLTTLIDQNPNEFWEAAQHEFGVALQSMSLDLMDSLDARLDSLGRKVTRLEITTKEIVAIRDARAYARETESTFTAEQERAEKSLLAQWLRSFVHRLPKVRRKPALEHAIEIGLGLDAVDFAFCRYALNIAICSSHVSQQKIISSRIPNVLVGMVDGANASMAISDASALVVGPSLMALAHIARADGPAREAIAEANRRRFIISMALLPTWQGNL